MNIAFRECGHYGSRSGGIRTKQRKRGASAGATGRGADEIIERCQVSVRPLVSQHDRSVGEKPRETNIWSPGWNSMQRLIPLLLQRRWILPVAIGLIENSRIPLSEVIRPFLHIARLKRKRCAYRRLRSVVVNDSIRRPENEGPETPIGQNIWTQWHRFLPVRSAPFATLSATLRYAGGHS
jgi:hypothetical protein